MKTKNKKNISFLFTGDISLNDFYNDLWDKKVNPFAEIKQYLDEADLVIGNLECLMEGDNGENNKKKPRLKTKSTTLNYLIDMNLGLVTLAHNHVFDNLEDGFRKTLAFLHDKGIGYTGAQLVGKINKPFFMQAGHQNFCFLNYVHPDTNPSLPENSGIHLNIYDKEAIIQDINKYKKDHVVILLLHWGGIYEHGKFPALYQRNDAREFIDAGCSLLIGHHSHTLQPHERYKGKSIFYSLGNFCFSPIYNNGKVTRFDRRRHNESILLKVNFLTNENYSFETIPIKNKSLFIKKGTKMQVLKFRLQNIIFKKLLKYRVIRRLYHVWFSIFDPVFYQIFRKDQDRSFLKRLKELNLFKIKSMFRKNV